MEARSQRILVLAAVFFLSGLAFFIVRATDTRDAPLRVASSPVENDRALAPHLASLPAPEVYERFTYAGEESRTVQGTCAAAYYAILIYPVDVDYRMSPADARYNRAQPCTGAVFSHEVEFASGSFVEGTEYYVIKAHQGNTGGWYDPY